MEAKKATCSDALRKELQALGDVKSVQMRHLSAKGMPRADIARTLSAYYGKPVRYQHVKNVLDKPLKK